VQVLRLRGSTHRSRVAWQASSSSPVCGAAYRAISCGTFVSSYVWPFGERLRHAGQTFFEVSYSAMIAEKILGLGHLLMGASARALHGGSPAVFSQSLDTFGLGGIMRASRCVRRSLMATWLTFRICDERCIVFSTHFASAFAARTYGILLRCLRYVLSTHFASALAVRTYGILLRSHSHSLDLTTG
jgi:hypothetical protein